MSANRTAPSLRERQLLDDAVLAYVEWREESSAVWDAYRRWASADPEDTPRAHAAYTAALDREEAAANCYSKMLDRVVGEALESAPNRDAPC